MTDYKVNVKKITIDRARQGLSLRELANKSEVGRSTISRIENGAGNNRLDTIGRIAKALGKDIVEYLIFEE